jgi:eukaryotic-like serine/threonine-protein kinase
MKLCLACDQKYPEDMDLCPIDGQILVPLGKDRLIGTVIEDRYRVEALVGRGSMGAVYRAIQQPIGREVALKVLLHHLGDDTDAIKRFHREAKAASRLNHQHITTVYDFGVMPDGQPYLVMDFLKGVNLEELIAKKDHLTIEELHPIIKQVCEALGEAHRQGVIHRDVKPENIVLVEKDGSSNFVKVVDFGVAKFIQDPEGSMGRLTKTGNLCGSPAYMSPEQCQSKPIDHRCDIYAMGVVLFESLTGTLPFLAPDLMQLMFMHVTERAPLLSETRPDLPFSPAIVRVVNKALSKEPNDRQQSMSQLWDEFDWASRNHEAAQSGGYRRTYSSSQTAETSRFQAVTEEMEAPGARRMSENLPVAFRADSKSTPYGQNIGPYAILVGIVIAIIGIIVLFTVVNGGKTTHWLVTHGQYEEALYQLKSRQLKGQLSKAELEDLNATYLALAKKSWQSGRYDQAVGYLQQISPKAKQASQAKRLLRKYRQRGK